MATATKTKKAKAAKPVTFFSRSHNQRLTFEPPDVVRNARDRVIETIPAKAIQFENGLYVWDPKDEARDEWERSEETLDWLRAHPKLNTQREGAFWEKGAAPDEPRPTLAEQQMAITTAAVAKNAEALKEILERERDSHKRDSVIDLAEVALEQVQGEGSDSDSSPAPEQTS